MSLSKLIKKSVPAAVLTAGFVAFGSGAASAATVPGVDDALKNDKVGNSVKQLPSCEELATEKLSDLCDLASLERLGELQPTNINTGSVTGELPAADKLPSLRDLPQLPSLPSLPGLPAEKPVHTLPAKAAAGLPALPSLPGKLPSLPSMPGKLPSLPSLSNQLQQHPMHVNGALGGTELPQLPGQDALTELTELPDVPGLPGAEELGQHLNGLRG